VKDSPQVQAFRSANPRAGRRVRSQPARLLRLDQFACLRFHSLGPIGQLGDKGDEIAWQLIALLGPERVFDGHFMGDDHTARLWPSPVAVEGDPPPITCWFQVITGMEL
jgi:hypothetical protein